MADSAKSKSSGALRYFLSGGVGLGMLNLSSAGLGFAISVYLARTLGASEFGTFAFAIGIATLLALPLTGGLPTLMVREIASARERGKPEKVLGIVRWGFLLQASIVSALIAIAAICYWTASVMGIWPFNTHETLIAGLVLLLVPVMGMLQVQRGILAGHGKVVLGGMGEQLFRPALMLALLVVAAPILAYGSLGALAIQISAGLGAALAVTALTHKAVPRYVAKTRVMHHQEWVRALLPLTGTTAILVLTNNTDIFMLGMLGPPENVGGYRIAAQIAALAAMPMQIVRALAAPRIAGAHAREDFKGMQVELVQAARIVSCAALGYLLLFAIFGKPFLAWIFGPEFMIAYGPCLVLVVGTIVSCGCGLVSVTLQLTCNARLVAWSAAVAAVANLLLNLLLVPIYGPIGAAIGTTVALVAMQLQLWVQVRLVLKRRIDVFANLPLRARRLP